MFAPDQYNSLWHIRRIRTMAKQEIPARRTATQRVRPGIRTAEAKGPSMTWGFSFGKMNLILLLVGVAVIVIGYLLMGTAISDGDPAMNDGIWNNANAVTFAPILLTIGYGFIIPFAILYRGKKEEEAKVEEQVA